MCSKLQKLGYGLILGSACLYGHSTYRTITENIKKQKELDEIIYNFKTYRFVSSNKNLRDVFDEKNKTYEIDRTFIKSIDFDKEFDSAYDPANCFLFGRVLHVTDDSTKIISDENRVLKFITLDKKTGNISNTTCPYGFPITSF